MIEWKLLALSDDGHEVVLDLMAPPPEGYSLKETDNIQFQVAIENEDLIKFGAPSVLLGDVPVELDFHHLSGNSRVYCSTIPLENHSSRYFYNFFGDSEVGLVFDGNSDFIVTCTINILARSENAQLANEMLGYLTDNLEDAVSVCFSRSKITGGHDRLETFNFTRLDIVEKAISYLFESLPLFLREHKHSWTTQMQLSERGQPIGPDSIYWVLNHLDELTPSSIDEANLVYNNRSYKIDKVPREDIVSESDVYENRVINTFLHNISLFLMELRDSFNKSSNRANEYVDSDYVRFDHTMRRFTQIALKHKVAHVDRLIISVEQIRKAFAKKLPSRMVPGLQPRMTSYVAKHMHYRTAFKLIEECYTAPAPTFEGSNVLFGLKNLAIVYEISSLLMLHAAIIRNFSVKTVETNYRIHNQDHPFGGIEQERPFGTVNNYFAYRSDVYDIELFYEPKIFPYSSKSLPGDLVDTSDTRASSEYGKHHYCPDFILKVRSKRWKRPLTIILDSKYKDSATVKKFDLGPLTHKYLLNIHQVNNKRSLGVSPIKLLLVLFAHGKTGDSVKSVANRHTLTGTLPVLPQAAGILLKPSEVSLLDENLKAITRVMNEESLEYE